MKDTRTRAARYALTEKGAEMLRQDAARRAVNAFFYGTPAMYAAAAAKLERVK